MKSKSGFILLSVILSMLLVIGALAVFSIVSGRFSITRHMNRRVQAFRDAESASYVVYQMLREGASGWSIPDVASSPQPHKVTIYGKTIDVNIYSDGKIETTASY